MVASLGIILDAILNNNMQLPGDNVCFLISFSSSLYFSLKIESGLSGISSESSRSIYFYLFNTNDYDQLCSDFEGKLEED